MGLGGVENKQMMYVNKLGHVTVAMKVSHSMEPLYRVALFRKNYFNYFKISLYI